MDESAFDVVWPLGRRAQVATEAPDGAGVSAQAAGGKGRASGSIDLNSATVAFLWTYNRKGDRMYDIMKGTLRGEYPDIQFVDYDVFGNIHGAQEREVVAAIPRLLREHRADIAVIGVAG